MYQVDFSRPVRVHFTGIGGISMSGLAAVLLRAGFPVSGSDVRRSALTERLEEMGAVIAYEQVASNITEDLDLLVYTAAVHMDHPELARAAELGIPMLTRAQLLGEIMHNYDTPVAVAGTHGKTTTTSMISCMALAAELDPTISVGGILPCIGGNLRVGESGCFIAEACEYTNSFLELEPKISIILNVDADHLDFFKDLEDIRHSFRKFAQKTLPGGTLIVHGGIDRLDEITQGLPCRVVTFGTEGSDYAPAQMTSDEKGCYTFDLMKEGAFFGHLTLHVPGIHNVSNACAAAAAADVLGISPEAMQRGLDLFIGAERRFQHKGEFNGVTIIDDYAHHPAEIRATLEAAAQMKHDRIWCAFQPHTYTRTQKLLPEFAEALSLADRVVLADIYAAREKNTIGISSDDLRARLTDKGCQAWYFPEFAQIEDFLADRMESGDLLITMGAGDIYKVGEDLLHRS